MLSEGWRQTSKGVKFFVQILTLYWLFWLLPFTWQNLALVSQIAFTRLSLFSLMLVPALAFVISLWNANFYKAKYVEIEIIEGITLAFFSQDAGLASVPLALLCIYTASVCFLAGKVIFDTFCPVKIKTYQSLPKYLAAAAKQAYEIGELLKAHAEASEKAAELQISRFEALRRNSSGQRAAWLERLKNRLLSKAEEGRRKTELKRFDLIVRPVERWEADNRRQPHMRFVCSLLFSVSIFLWGLTAFIIAPALVFFAAQPGVNADRLTNRLLQFLSLGF